MGVGRGSEVMGKAYLLTLRGVIQRNCSLLGKRWSPQKWKDLGFGHGTRNTESERGAGFPTASGMPGRPDSCKAGLFFALLLRPSLCHWWQELIIWCVFILFDDSPFSFLSIFCIFISSSYNSFSSKCDSRQSASKSAVTPVLHANLWLCGKSKSDSGGSRLSNRFDKWF